MDECTSLIVAISLLLHRNLRNFVAIVLQWKNSNPVYI